MSGENVIRLPTKARPRKVGANNLAISAQDFAHLQIAVATMGKAMMRIRLFEALFDEDDDELRKVSVTDLKCLAEEIVQLISNVGTSLFSMSWNEPAGTLWVRHASSTWKAFDLAKVILAVLESGKLPNGDAPDGTKSTAQPILGAMRILTPMCRKILLALERHVSEEAALKAG